MTTDSLGRVAGPRRRRTIEEKRRIVEETLVPGASVPSVARKHEVNANLVFGWRRLYQQGLLEVREGGVSMALLPVAAAPLRKRRLKRSRITTRVARAPITHGPIEIRFPGGGSISVQGAVSPEVLARVIELMARG